MLQVRQLVAFSLHVAQLVEQNLQAGRPLTVVKNSLLAHPDTQVALATSRSGKLPCRLHVVQDVEVPLQVKQLGEHCAHTAVPLRGSYSPVGQVCTQLPVDGSNR